MSLYRNILLVDDDPDDLDLLLDAISSINEKIVCQTAKNGALAIESLDTNFPDLIISDVNMPGIDGIRLTTIIKQEMQLAVPIVMISTSAAEKEIALKAGADIFFQKCYRLIEWEKQLRCVLSTKFVNANK